MKLLKAFGLLTFVQELVVPDLTHLWLKFVNPPFFWWLGRNHSKKPRQWSLKVADSEREKVIENLKSEHFNVLELLDGTFVAQGKSYSDIREKKVRCRQDLNLRGETPLDFKSNALTTRPQQLVNLIL